MSIKKPKPKNLSVYRSVRVNMTPTKMHTPSPRVFTHRSLECDMKAHYGQLFSGQPRIITRPLIHGQPAVLLCTNLPSAVTGVWTRNGSSTTLCPPPSTCINSPDSDNGYQFARNATGISVSISNITRIEEQPWTCGTLGGGPTDTYTIEYANVFGKFKYQFGVCFVLFSSGLLMLQY